MCTAETGSGKTAAFVIPMLVYIQNMPPLTPETEASGPYALVMAPSRELIQQIQDQAVMVARHTRVRIVPLFGGTSVEDQAFVLRKGCEIVVATPGRLVDMLGSRHVALSQCYYVVLDEADRMVSMGFEQQLNEVLDAMPASNLKSLDEAEAELQESQQSAAIAAARATAGAAAAADVSSRCIFRTTVMFSATMPPAVERLARKYLRRPAQVQIGSAGRVVDTVEQRVIWTPNESSKRQQLRQALESAEPPIMIFLNLKTNVEALAKQLVRDGWRAAALHSGRSQDKRSSAMDGFKDGAYDILVATDVAGRGIDVHGVQLVLNYDMPKKIEDYTHRVGRTGRRGLQGRSISFLSPDDTEIMYDLRQMLLETNNPVPPELNSHPAALSRDPSAKPKSKDQIFATGIKEKH
jgi:ATP-dependent RNA helicase DDX23/PRP28